MTLADRMAEWHLSEITTALRVLSNNPPPSVGAAAERTIAHSRRMIAHLYRVQAGQKAVR